jgi:hypothetical protein
MISGWFFDGDRLDSLGIDESWDPNTAIMNFRPRKHIPKSG